MFRRLHPIQVVLAAIALAGWMASPTSAANPGTAPAQDDGITSGGPDQLLQMSQPHPGQPVQRITAQPLFIKSARPAAFGMPPATQPVTTIKPMSAAAYGAYAPSRIDTNYFRADGPNQAAAAAAGDPYANLAPVPPNPYLAPDTNSVPDVDNSYAGPYDDSYYDNTAVYAYPNDSGYYDTYPYVYTYPQYCGPYYYGGYGYYGGGRAFHRFGRFYDHGFHGGLSGSGHFNGFQSGGFRGGGFGGGSVQGGAMRGGGGSFHSSGGGHGGGHR